MFKIIFRHNFFLIFAVSFTIAVIIISLIMSGSSGYNKILKNGVRTEAEVVQYSATSNVEVNGIPYYKVKYTFKDEFDNTHTGYTSTSYTYDEALDIEEKGFIIIKYDPETYESVEANYSSKKDVNHSTVLYIVIIVFGAVAVITWIASFGQMRKNFIYFKVSENGQEYSAVVNDFSSNVRVNNVSKYRIYYTWTDEMGVSHSDKTDHSYYYEEAMALKNQGTITIRAIKDYSAVVTKPDLEKYLYQNHTNERVGATIQCQYCGKDILDSDVVCPHCKSRIIK